MRENLLPMGTILPTNESRALPLARVARERKLGQEGVSPNAGRFDVERSRTEAKRSKVTADGVSEG